MVLPVVAAGARAGASKTSPYAKRNALIRARRVFRQAKTKTEFTGEKPSKFLYLAVGLIALLKDLLDLVFIGSFPGIAVVVTFFFSFLIWILLLLFDRSGGRQNRLIIRGLVVIFFGLVEALAFGLNFLPIETLTVVVLYSLARSAWKKEEKRLKPQRDAQNNAERIREYQMARAEASANEERYRVEEAANDDQYQDNQSRKVA